jgi:rubrerythrin
MSPVRPIRCRICGETYVGPGIPPACPFCGAHDLYLVDADEFPRGLNDVQLTEVERDLLQQAIAIERSNARYYVAVAKLPGDDALCSAFKRLSRIEAEHCSVFSKLLREPKPTDLDEPEGEVQGWAAAVAESSAREHRAAEFYGQAATSATSLRLREVFTAIASVEVDHIAFDEQAAGRVEG